MLSTSLRIVCALLFCCALLAQTGCACGKPECVQAKAPEPAPAPCAPRSACEKPAGELVADLPPNAKPGECWAKVYVPPTFKTVSERILVREASETVEVVPAKYEWVEERIMVKDASTQLEVVPAEFATRERTIEVNPGHTDWEINKHAECVNPKEQPARDVFCLVKHPPEHRTVQTQAVVKPPQVRTVCIPAQYDTVRREKLVTPATTRRTCIPAEYDTVEKTVKVCEGRMAWQRVACEVPGAEKVTASANPSQSIATVNAQRSGR